MKKFFKIIFLFLLFFMISGCITPDDPAPEEEEDDGIVYHDLTMSNDCVDTNEVQTLLAITGNNNIYEVNDGYYDNVLNYKLTYKNINGEQIEISLISDSASEKSALQVKYNNDIYRMVSNGTREDSSNNNCGSYGVYDRANIWTKQTGRITDGYCYADNYTGVINFPIFSGDWTIDNKNSTELGKQYLANILFESTGETKEIENKRLNKVTFNKNIDITNIKTGQYNIGSFYKELDYFTDGLLRYGNNDPIVYNKKDSTETLSIYFGSTSSSRLTNIFVEHYDGRFLLEKYIYSNDDDAYNSSCVFSYVNAKNKWAKLTGDITCLLDYEDNYYKEVSSLPIFYGTWELNESTVNDNNRGLLSLNILTESKNEEEKLYHDLTMDNPSIKTKDVQSLLKILGYEIIYDNNNDYIPKYKLTYKNENNDTITISLLIDTTFGESVIELKYKNDIYRIASSNVKYHNSLYNHGPYGYYDEAYVWTKLDGTINGKYNFDDYVTVPYYKKTTNFPVFYGEWSIDEDNSTDLGKHMLSNILFVK